MQRAALFSLAAGASVVYAWQPVIHQQFQRNLLSRPLPRTSILPNYGSDGLSEAPVTTEDEAPVTTEDEPPRTIEDDIPTLLLEYDLVKEVDFQTAAAEEDEKRMVEFQSQLEKSVELKNKVESMFKLELEAMEGTLAIEMVEEQQRSEGIIELMEKFSAAITNKREFVKKDEDLLLSMQQTQEQVRESSIEAQLAQAVTDKMSLITIERELIDKMDDCVRQLAAELDECKSRTNKMAEVMKTLDTSSEGNAESARAFTWDEVADLRDLIDETAQVSAEREKNIDSIKQAFQEALFRRRQVLEPEIVSEELEREKDLKNLQDASETAVRRNKESEITASTTNTEVTGSTTPDIYLKETGNALKNVLNEALNSVIRFSLRPELSAAVENLLQAGGSLVNSVASLSKATSAFTDEWNSAIDEKLATTIGSGDKSDKSDEWWVVAAFRKASSSPAVESLLQDSAKDLSSAGQFLVESGKSAAALSSGSDNTKLLAATSELSSAISKSTKAASGVVDRELNPPPVDFSGSAFILPSEEK